MAQYEVLILGENAKARTYIETQHGDDQEAVRSALRIANGRPFEVWRDLTCIHRTQQITSCAA